MSDEKNVPDFVRTARRRRYSRNNQRHVHFHVDTRVIPSAFSRARSGRGRVRSSSLSPSSDASGEIAEEVSALGEVRVIMN